MKFLLIEDHALYRRGLLFLLEQLPGEHQFLESDNCEDAISKASVHPDISLILLDLALPGMNGLDGLLRLRSLCPTTPIVLLSANDNSRLIVDGMRRGAQGFIPKSSSPEVMTAALQVVLAGGTYVPLQGVLRDSPSLNESRSLTGRQREVLALIARDYSNKEIAMQLGMRVNTVRVHVAAILDALNVANRVEAARMAAALGLSSDAR
ncbi:response regulator transcription factor [Massilia solisilvae]|uniref:Response regulator transcription factor n=1 Tax=Massilia solisilvae TaxID=1811225 RepID=A0ABT2BLM7_9BURK|nr:response regulator transcription factor [Massilia solisilvae]MCS0609365.1 response regulator transcription factor [Massilia solisilvae]